jgi:formylglycine-generating enzyme required for sulfatase activity
MACAVFLLACDVTGDGTTGAAQCSQAAAVAACPAGSVPRLDAASSAQCGGTAAGSYSPISGADGSISGACAADGECAFACIFETPCRCGTETLSRDAIVCTSPCSACGNSICEDGESVESCPSDCTAACGNGECERGETAETCSLDCGGTCVPGEQRCNGGDRQVCNPRGQYEVVDCTGENRCRETDGGTTECVSVASAVCDEVSRCCDGAYARAVGEACDDGLFCTSASSCNGEGQCAAPVERDCATELSLTACQTAACDEVRDRCEAQPTNEGAVCDNPETATGDRCVDGACVASDCECTGINDCCDGCFVLNVGGACDDGAFCTTGDTCTPTGQCIAGVPRSCAGTPVGNCQTAVCDDEVDACRAVSSPDLAGTSCDDGLYCTVGETCSAAGACEVGRPRDCSGVISVAACQANPACDEGVDQCTFVAVNAGGACTSADFCTVNATCDAAGGCAGTPRDCSEEPTDLDCQGAAFCNSEEGRCAAPAINNGGACDDGDLCTQTDTCLSGECTSGTPLACGTATACRAAGTCDPSTGACTGTAQPDGTSCVIANGFGTCQTGDCRITSCRAGFGDCDGTISNGCETVIDNNVDNCGICGNSCGESYYLGVCDSGVCPLATGEPDWVYCQSPPRRGDLPVNTDNDPDNCGRCGEVCGALSTCEEGACVPVPLEFVRIESGNFQMGSPTGELGRSSDETRHSVVLTRDFLLATTETTQSQWELYMNLDPTLNDDPNRPITGVNWWDALEFANTVSQAQGLSPCYTLIGCTGTPGRNFDCTGLGVTGTGNNPYNCTGYRLPTEAEWEYAYRAGTTTAFYNGDITQTGNTPLDPNLDAIGWYAGNLSEVFIGSGKKNVGRKQPNAWGLYDMAGNVWEWCWDLYGTYPGAVSDPLGPSGSVRVFRGGSFVLVASGARAAFRNFNAPSYRGSTVGFRVARTAP